MKSLSDLAARYEAWAEAAESASEEILARLDSLSVEVREDQRWRAKRLTAEAVELRARAEELLKLELRRSIKYVPYRRCIVEATNTEE